MTIVSPLSTITITHYVQATQIFRQGKRILKIPLNGQRKFELKNNGYKSRYVEVSLYSCRLSILESRRNSIDEFEFSVYLKPKYSLIFTVADRGRVEYTNEWTFANEGLFGIRATERECVEGQTTPNGPSLQLPYMVVTLDPETDSYRTFCEDKDYNAEMVLEHIPRNHPMNKIITIEPVPKGKYEKTVPENVTVLKLNEKDEEDNKEMESWIAERVRIAMEKRKNWPKKEPPKLDSSKGSRTLRNDVSVSNTAKSQKKNEPNTTEQQQMHKLMEQYLEYSQPECITRKISDMVDKLNDERDQMYQENKDEKSEAKSLSENSKSTLKSEKTTRSESIRKSEKVDLPQLKNEGKKKQKKKCVIS
ncbi:hypothetical protein CAEBREN_23873 [Caenorhabditis brenneri]|uniref:Uncharacterized protein n=1 Tax=Caenorhabditis brenneri TaxID=135651 RepID=G0NDJ9_CAEBE|nr:hypothetical protein CAEBREN_23873 [Caenorhabditis brenneri]